MKIQYLNYVVAAALTVLGAFTAESVRAQPTTDGGQVENNESWMIPTFQVGAHVGGSLNLPSAEFSGLPGVVNCVGDSILFSGGSGGGFNVSGLVGLRPYVHGTFLSHLGFVAKIGYASSSTSFEADEHIGRSITPEGSVLPVVARYTIETTISELRLEPTVFYQVSMDVPVMFSLGARLGYVIGSTYDQKETIASPVDAEYADGSLERNINSGDLQDVSSIQAGLLAGLGYDIVLSRTIAVRPEISYTLGLTSPVSGVTWRADELRGGVSFLFTPTPPLADPLTPGRNRPNE